MFDVDGEIRRWRERQERTSSLSPRELDELEDHLRARTRLELELNAALAPERAFAIARQALGEADEVSREFAKAGKPRWRRWVVAGWSMYAASWFLPVYDFFGTTYGYQMLEEMTVDIPGAVILVALNMPMLMTLPMLWGTRLSSSRWVRRLVGIVSVLIIGWLGVGLIWGSIERGSVTWLFPPPLREGFWAWAASFPCVARGLRLRAKAWASARARTAPA